MTRETFVMCGMPCPQHPELRCDLKEQHVTLAGLIKHRSGDVVWGSNGHQHLTPLQEAFRNAAFQAMLDTGAAFGDRVPTDRTPFWGDGPSGMTADPKPITAEQELAEWWRETAEKEIVQTVAKAVEYGSTDLIDIGRSLARVAGRDIDDATAAEWGVFFYLEGKLSRWRSAITRGDVPSFDTLLDIGVYARMAQRIRMTGGWPGTEQEDEDK